MAEVKKSRIFLRRGTDAARLGTTLCEAELGYSTDGKRVFVGDDSTVGGLTVGNKVWVLDAGTDVTTLTSASGDGRAELGDLAWVPSSQYNVTDINPEAPSAPITPATDTGLLYALSASNGAGDLTWVLANSGIPLTQVEIPDNGINGDKIHGGDISGAVTFSDSITGASGLDLPGIKANAENTAGLVGSIIYPLGITANSEVTAVSSINNLGLNSNIGNSIGYVKSATTSSTSAISATNQNNTISQTIGATNNGLGSLTIESYIGDYYFGTLGASYGRGTGTWNVQEVVYTENHVQQALHNTNVKWDMIEEFYFSVYADHYDDAVCFLGFYNESTVNNEIVFFSGSSIDGGAMRNVPNVGRVAITNTYSSTKELKIHTGMDNGKISYVLTGVKVRR
jgi:hypothetical protein